MGRRLSNARRPASNFTPAVVQSAVPARGMDTMTGSFSPGKSSSPRRLRREPLQQCGCFQSDQNIGNRQYCHSSFWKYTPLVPRSLSLWSLPVPRLRRLVVRTILGDLGSVHRVAQTKHSGMVQDAGNVGWIVPVPFKGPPFNPQLVDSTMRMVPSSRISMGSATACRFRLAPLVVRWSNIYHCPWTHTIPPWLFPIGYAAFMSFLPSRPISLEEWIGPLWINPLSGNRLIA